MPGLRFYSLLTLLAGLGLAVAAPSGNAAESGDWPGWRGSDRTGLSKETGFLKEWPSGGPKLAWKVTGLGDGFATPSVANGRIYVMGTEAKIEKLFCLDVKDGKKLWATEVGSPMGGHAGVRSTPTIDGKNAYVLSSDGKLVCAETETGSVVWKKDLRADFAGKFGGWACTESPLIDGEVLVCTPGGEQAPLVTLNKATGELVWKADLTGLPEKGGKRSYATAGYSSIIVAEHGKVKQYIQFLSGGVVGVDAKSGKLLWHYDKPANGTANCSTPIFRDGSVFAASAYGNGGGLAKLEVNGGKFTANEAYFIKEMQNHHGGMILVGDHVYGTGNNELLCVEFKTGKIAWKERSVGKGSVAYADGHLYVRSEKGPIALVEANPAAYKEKGRFDQPNRSEKNAWAHPVATGGKLLIRDWDVLLCYEIKE